MGTRGLRPPAYGSIYKVDRELIVADATMGTLSADLGPMGQIGRVPLVGCLDVK